MERRRFIATAGGAAAILLAGCGDATPDDPESESVPANRVETNTDEGVSSPTEGPTTVVDAFVSAATERDVETAKSLLHPSHPFHPRNTDEDEDVAFERLLGSVSAESVDSELVAKNVSVETVSEQINGAKKLLGEDRLKSALDSGQSALVEARVKAESAKPMTLTAVVVSHDGDWLLLWQTCADVTSVESANAELSWERHHG